MHTDIIWNPSASKFPIVGLMGLTINTRSAENRLPPLVDYLGACIVEPSQKLTWTSLIHYVYLSVHLI